MEQKRGRSGRPIYKELSHRKIKSSFHLHEEAKLYQVLDYFEFFEQEREQLRGRSYSNFILRQKKLGDPLNYLRTIWNANGCGKMYNEWKALPIDTLVDTAGVRQEIAPVINLFIVPSIFISPV